MLKDIGMLWHLLLKSLGWEKLYLLPTYLPTLQIFDYFSDFDIVEDYIDILEALNDELV